MNKPPQWTGPGPSVDVIIVNWNNADTVLAAARSALEFGARVIVVDNASVDGSPDLIRQHVPEATIVSMGFNSGFARACNAGVAAGSGELVFLLNPDAVIVSGSASDLAVAFGSNPDTVIVGPGILDAAGRPTHSTRMFPTTMSMALCQFKLHRMSRWVPALRRYFMLDMDIRYPRIVDQVIGAALVMRRQDWLRFHGLDEGYFLLFEEVDLCRRVADDGGCALYWPIVQVRHIGGTSFRRLTHSRLQVLWSTSLRRYARLHLGSGSALLLTMTIPIALTLDAMWDIGEASWRWARFWR